LPSVKATLPCRFSGPEIGCVTQSSCFDAIGRIGPLVDSSEECQKPGKSELVWL
jgi:hypothetical protein